MQKMGSGLGFVAWVAGIVLLTFASGASAQGMMRAAWRERDSLDPLPVVHASMRVEVDRQYAHIRLDQHFENRSREQLEARYTLRTGADASVLGFAYYNGETRIVGEVFEKEVAREIYEEVSGQGRDPGLLEQEGEGQFGFRVFPLEAGETKRVQVDLGQWLPQHGRTVALETPWRFGDDVRVRLRDERGLGMPRSTTHALRVRRVSEVEVSLEIGARKGEGDSLAIEYDVGQPPLTLTAATHRDPGLDGYLLLQLATPRRTDAAKVSAKDVTVVIDRSGSMQGAAMQQARRAASALVGRLAGKDRLNVVAFDSQAERLFERPQFVNKAVREQALRFIEGLDAGGGTDIAAALSSAFEAQLRDDQPNVVLFLTDGESDSRAALKVARADTSDARLFTIGLGNGVDKALLSRLSSEKRGRFTFIASEQAIEPRMRELYTRIAAPLLVNLELGASGGRLARRYPQTLPDVFVDDELRVWTRFVPDLERKKPMQVWLDATLDGKRVRYSAKVNPEAVRRPWVGRAWAHARVDDLLEQIALDGETEERTDEAIELSLAYNFVTPYTSFLAIPESEVSDAVADTLNSARERKRAIQQARKDALALSRSEMPPGDPVLSVDAPLDATRVLALFPFGLQLDLRWDDYLERWTTRFLVPNGVPDGDYEVEVWIVHADGHLAYATVPYTIDSHVNEPEVQLRPAPGGLWVRILTDDEPREVKALLEGLPETRTVLAGGESEGCRTAFLAAPPGRHSLVVVVTDRARNEVRIRREVEVGSGPSQTAEGSGSWCN